MVGGEKYCVLLEFFGLVRNVKRVGGWAGRSVS